ncbi:hypothetical protein FACS1894190_12830 [Spirochaetia bacterium]|nr:hypothetical protein FACS1894190_12830 [Spirochaetia bacterium]
MQIMEIRETEIEDILVNSPRVTKKILRLDDDPKLIGRQIILPSGRLDMLYTYKTVFLLLELKIVAFQKKFIQQVLNYKHDLEEFQKSGKLLSGEIQPLLVLPSINKKDIDFAARQGVKCLEYNPEEILKYFYSDKLKPITSFVELKPIDIGIWNIHLINKFIFDLEKTNSVKILKAEYDGAQKSLYNKIKFSSELNLVNWMPNCDNIELTALGKNYVNAKDTSYLDRLSDKQSSLLRNFVMQNPYSSSVVLGIASFVESIFALSKNTYPVEIEQLKKYFTVYSGKMYDWQTDKAQTHAVKMYSNYAIDLGLVAKTDNHVYLTPEGFKLEVENVTHWCYLPKLPTRGN